jgi:putative ABC transport system ATP-binding protein
VGFVKQHLLDERRCIVIVTHDERIDEFATRVLRMEDGRLIGTEHDRAA